MSGKCKFCQSPLDVGQSLCGVCKIDNHKDAKELSKEEKGVANHCRALRLLGILTIIGGSVEMLYSVPNLFMSKNSSGCLVFLFLLFWGAFSLFYGICLMSYAQWCYSAGIVLVSVSVLAPLFGFKIFGVGSLWAILLLIYILTSRKIFYRTV